MLLLWMSKNGIENCILVSVWSITKPVIYYISVLKIGPLPLKCKAFSLVIESVVSMVMHVFHDPRIFLIALTHSEGFWKNMSFILKAQ